MLLIMMINTKPKGHAAAGVQSKVTASAVDLKPTGFGFELILHVHDAIHLHPRSTQANKSCRLRA